MVYRNFQGDRESKISRDWENADDGLHTAFITPIQQTATWDGGGYVERKGQVPNNGDICIQPDAGMADQTRFNVGRDNKMWQSHGIRTTKQAGRQLKDIKDLQKITRYKCGQLNHCSRSCPFKEDEQENLKGKRIILDNILQGINYATTGILSMNVNHESDENNREIEYNSESDNKDDNNSEPTPGECFRQLSHHMNNGAGAWIHTGFFSTIRARCTCSATALSS